MAAEELEHRERCNSYLAARSGKYEWRRTRYKAAVDVMKRLGLTDQDTVLDLGAGWTELAYTLHVEGGSRARYWPVDGGLDGVNIEKWSPRQVEFIVALEILEHLNRPALMRLMPELQANARKGLIVSVPNPETTDVLAMDSTHVTVVTREMLVGWGFVVSAVSFYGKDNDSLFAVWKPYHWQFDSAADVMPTATEALEKGGLDKRLDRVTATSQEIDKRVYRYADRSVADFGDVELQIASEDYETYDVKFVVQWDNVATVGVPEIIGMFYRKGVSVDDAWIAGDPAVLLSKKAIAAYEDRIYMEV